MTFVTKDLDLVLFLNARNRIKQNCREAVRNYIERRGALYARRCNQEQETATHRKLRHLIGAEESRSWCGAFSRPLKLKRDLIKDQPWKLAPNRYDVPLEVYGKHKGAGGAHWPKVHTHKSLLEKQVERRVRYNVKAKGRSISWLFPGNARERRATLRCMVNSLAGCYRDQNDPGPTRYRPRHHMIEARVCPPKKSEPPNPHIFLRYSCVPATANSLVPKHISMDPTPGRYEIRYPFFCPCGRKLTYMPGLKLFIDRQKRNRFRNLPFERIKTRLYCDPEWRHVKGHGFGYLFKLSAPTKYVKQKASENLRLKFYHDQKYKDMITYPIRPAISNPSGEVPHIPVRLKFNILSKRVIRKQLRSNKKIAFNSGQERWKDGYRLPPLTAKQQQANKARLPLERQLIDYPVFRKPLDMIQPKLDEIPEHMKPTYMPELRKRLFKFLPLPGAKVLVTEQDTRPHVVNGVIQCEGFYSKEVAPEDYFNDGIARRRAEEERRAKAELHAAQEAAANALQEEKDDEGRNSKIIIEKTHHVSHQ